MFFPLNLQVDIQRSTPIENRSGQFKASFSTLYENINCLFYPVSGKRNTNVLVEFGQTAEFYFEPSVDIQEGDQLVNILNVNNELVDNGPYLAVFVRRVANLGGRSHHITVKAQGIGA